MIRIRKKIREMAPSPTLEITAKAAELRAAGRKVVAFAAGQPDFPTPPHVCEAAFAAVRAGLTGYTASAGLPELRAAVAEHYTARLGRRIEPANVAITVGAKNALALFLEATLGPGDEVIVPAPYWVSYPEMLTLAGAKAKVVKCGPDTGYLLTPRALARAATPRTRAVILNSPSNPTGAVLDPEEVEAVSRKALDRGISILSDEIYEYLLYDGARHVSPLSLFPDRLDSIAVVSGPSKTFSMTGWRVGWLIASADVVRAVSKIIGQTTSGPTTFVQKACVAALRGDRTFLDGWIETYRARRDRMLEGLRAIPGLTPLVPRGAFYVWADVRPLMKRTFPDGRRVATSAALAMYLLDGEGVATVPGSAFGAEGHLRLSFATSMQDVEEGVARMALAVARLGGG